MKILVSSFVISKGERSTFGPANTLLYFDGEKVEEHASRLFMLREPVNDFFIQAPPSENTFTKHHRPS